MMDWSWTKKTTVFNPKKKKKKKRPLLQIVLIWWSARFKRCSINLWWSIGTRNKLALYSIDFNWASRDMLKHCTLFLGYCIVYCHIVLYIKQFMSFNSVYPHHGHQWRLRKCTKKYIPFINLSYYKNTIRFTIIFAIWKSIFGYCNASKAPLIFVNSHEQGLSSSIQFRFTRTLNKMTQMNLYKF